MRWPDVYIVGAAKSGTSSLATYLAQHPDIGFCKHKEPNYFAFLGRDLHNMPGPAPGWLLYNLLYSGSATTLHDYETLFEDVSNRPVLAEASVRYLYGADIAQRIFSASPNARIVIVLREPIARTWSHYAMMRYAFGLEPLTWRPAISAEASRIKAGWDYDWHYTAVSLYSAQVRRYIDIFGRHRVRVYWQASLAADPIGVVQDICRFVKVSDNFRPDVSVREKAGFQVRSLLIHQLLKGRSLLNTPSHGTPSCRQRLQAFFHRLNRARLAPPPAALKKLLAPKMSRDRDDLAALLGSQPPW